MDEVCNTMFNWRVFFPGSVMGLFPTAIKLELSKKKGAA